jgi:hypothetical protein
MPHHMSENRIQLPPKGRAKEDILATMQALRQKDVKWREGKVFRGRSAVVDVALAPL